MLATRGRAGRASRRCRGARYPLDVRVLPLSLVSAGIALVALDLRIVNVDLVPDVVGWGLVAVGAWRLEDRLAAAAAGVATAAAVPDLALTYHWEDLDPITGEVVVGGGGTAYDQRIAFDLITDARAPLSVLALTSGGLALVILLGRLERKALVLGDQTAATHLLVGRVSIALAWVFPHLVVMLLQLLTGDGLDPVWGGSLELVALLGLLVAGLVGVTLARYRNRGWTATAAERAALARRPSRSWA